MAEIINLRARRKKAERTKKRDEASENAMKFGRTKGQKILEVRLAERSRDALDAHRREEPQE